ncbi:hypothetical protein EOJ36_04090 [Sandaracinomonas limnophila]|uniref:Polysaccharide biosynthesis protein n=1 Tax=Sandaracinomonas limnophila TaxID=1862386 RepID=A0A437PTM6_9BACT|nr:hypothetical protein [Sandaracinomonas limnophila]RVU25606.1 hypothetical protein EOJ36_04090 [Sandaracinomonas limnophila]
MKLNILNKNNLGERTIGQLNNIFYSAIYKCFGVVLNFLSVPIFLNFLDSSNYGIWLTISSVLSWISLLDLGIGNGLKNKLCENITQGNILTSRSLVSTSYFIFFIIVLILIVIFLFCNIFIDWGLVFKTSNADSANLKILMPTLIIFFSARFILDLINSILFAHQRADIVARNNFIINAFVFLGLVLLSKTVTQNKLFWLNIVSNGIPIIFLFCVSIFLFKNKFKLISPNWGTVNFSNTADILSVSLKFFAIQIASLVIFSSDNLIINSLFSPKEVTLYNIPYKLFSSFIFAWTIILTPLWTAFNEAFIRADFTWIKKAVWGLNVVWILLAVAVLVTIFWSSDIYKFWLGTSIIVPRRLTIFMGIFILISTYSNIYVYFLNGIGKIKIQFYISLMASIVNIPLCYLFVKYFGMNVDGIILATCLSISVNPLISLYQYYLIINNKAIGIWFS